MQKQFALGLLAAFFTSAAFSQSTFEIADIHPAVHGIQQRMQGPFPGAGRFEIRTANMVELITAAYGMDAEKITGGPNWLEMERFDILAKLPAGTTEESRKIMLQGLLAERFHLKVHNDSRNLVAFALNPGKHAQLKEPDGTGEPGCTISLPPQSPPQTDANGAPIRQLPVITYTCRATSMAALAAALPGMPGAQQYFSGTAVVDRTELKGTWDFSFKYTPKVPAGMVVSGESIPLFDAVDKQLGLKLEQAMLPVPVMVVDSVDRTPTPNPAEVSKAFPALPTEFDVVEIKPSVPLAGNLQGRPPEIKNGRFYVPGITLNNLIQIAWNLNGNDEALLGAPKWLDDDKFDIIAKTPPGVFIGTLNINAQGQQLNLEPLRPMLQNMLKERFKLSVHSEERPQTAYILQSTGKPKLNKADPGSRTRWKEGAASESKDKNVNTQLGRLVTCQNVTMAQFADMLPGIAPGYLRTEVVDATGLEGGYDFTFSFSPAGANQGGGRGGDGGAAATAADPSGALSLFDAMTKQLGLKLEMKKRPAPVLVIDHVEQKPTDN